MKDNRCIRHRLRSGHEILLGDFEFGIIKRKARQLVGRAGFKKQDLEYLEQELWVRLLQGLESFDPQIGHQKSFVTAVVERSVRKMLRDAQAALRNCGDQQSLEDIIVMSGEEPTRLSNTIGDREQNRRRGRHSRTAEELRLLASDLADVIDSLTEDQQQLAENLKTKTIAGSARELDVPRTTLNYVVRRLEDRFRKTHVDDYL